MAKKDTAVTPFVPNVPAAVGVDDEVMSAVVTATTFLPRLQFCTSSSEVCKEGKIGVNHYALISGEEAIDLGSSIDALVLSRRLLALDIANKIFNYTPDVVDGKITNPPFKDIMERADVKDSHCMFGPEFLMWLPEHGFCTFFMASKTARGESPKLSAILKGWASGDVQVPGATLKSQKIVKQYTWFAPVVLPCTTITEFPSEAEYNQQAETFNNPKNTALEVADDDDDSDRER